MSINGIVYASDVEAAVVSLADTEEIKTCIPPALLFHRGEVPVIREVWDTRPNKKVPHHVFLEQGDYRWYQDSALVETDFSPSRSAEEMFRKFYTATEMLEEFLRPKGYRPWFAPVSKFDESLVLEVGDEAVYQASIAGCNPDLDACDDEYDCETISLEQWQYRGVGGHLHISIGEEYGDIMHKRQSEIIRLFAITVGNMGVAIADEPDLEKKRKQVFGAPGKYRAKVYPNGRMGLEYRSLSASWLRSVETMEQIIESANFALTLVLNDFKTAQGLIDSFLEPSITAVSLVRQDDSRAILKQLGLL